jgi:glycosyltransferase involved in cell wall biosynthesis
MVYFVAYMKPHPGLSLSLCMIVKDEEHNLDRCLKSIDDVVDEIIVVDTGSTDHTPEIAADFHAKVLQYQWQDDFAAARNFSLNAANGDWILVLDADEELEGNSQGQLRSIVDGAQVDGFRIWQRNFTPPGELCRYYDLRLTRLFRNTPSFRFEGIVHEQIAPSILRHSGTLADADLIVLHHGYLQNTAQGSISRAGRNLALIQKALVQTPGDPYLHYQAGITFKQLGDMKNSREHLQRVLSLDYESLSSDTLEDVYTRLAQLAMAEKDYSATIKYATSGLRYNPDNLVAQYLLALVYMFVGDVKQAYPYFKQIRQSPENRLNDIDELDAILAYCRQVLGE